MFHHVTPVIARKDSTLKGIHSFLGSYAVIEHEADQFKHLRAKCKEMLLSTSKDLLFESTPQDVADLIIGLPTSNDIAEVADTQPELQCPNEDIGNKSGNELSPSADVQESMGIETTSIHDAAIEISGSVMVASVSTETFAPAEGNGGALPAITKTALNPSTSLPVRSIESTEQPSLLATSTAQDNDDNGASLSLDAISATAVAPERDSSSSDPPAPAKAVNGGIVPLLVDVTASMDRYQELDSNALNEAQKFLAAELAVAEKLATGSSQGPNEGTEALASPTRPSRKRKSSQEEGKAIKKKLKSGEKPSQYCHVCGGKVENKKWKECGNARTETCRKVTCEDCLRKHVLPASHPVENVFIDPEWTCTHCRGVCPPPLELPKSELEKLTAVEKKGARCFQYTRENHLRRLNGMLHRLHEIQDARWRGVPISSRQKNGEHSKKGRKAKVSISREIERIKERNLKKNKTKRSVKRKRDSCAAPGQVPNTLTEAPRSVLPSGIISSDAFARNQLAADIPHVIFDVRTIPPSTADTGNVPGENEVMISLQGAMSTSQDQCTDIYNQLTASQAFDLANQDISCLPEATLSAHGGKVVTNKHDILVQTDAVTDQTSFSKAPYVSTQEGWMGLHPMASALEISISQQKYFDAMGIFSESAPPELTEMPLQLERAPSIDSKGELSNGQALVDDETGTHVLFGEVDTAETLGATNVCGDAPLLRCDMQSDIPSTYIDNSFPGIDLDLQLFGRDTFCEMGDPNTSLDISPTGIQHSPFF